MKYFSSDQDHKSIPVITTIVVGRSCSNTCKFISVDGGLGFGWPMWSRGAWKSCRVGSFIYGDIDSDNDFRQQKVSFTNYKLALLLLL